MKTNPIRDLRKYSNQTFFRIIIGGLILLFIVGDGLIFLIYGRDAAVMGVLCILAGLAPVLLIGLFLMLMDWIIQKANRY